jgi:hypothetical protein
MSVEITAVSQGREGLPIVSLGRTTAGQAASDAVIGLVFL